MLRLRQCLARVMTSLTTVRPCTHVTVHQSTQPTIVKYADDLQVSGHPHLTWTHNIHTLVKKARQLLSLLSGERDLLQPAVVYSSATTESRKAVQGVINTAQKMLTCDANDNEAPSILESVKRDSPSNHSGLTDCNQLQELRQAQEPNSSRTPDHDECLLSKGV